MTQEEIENGLYNWHKETDIVSQTPINGFKAGAEFAQSKMYSEEELLKILLSFKEKFVLFAPNLDSKSVTDWFETVKKK